MVSGNVVICKECFRECSEKAIICPFCRNRLNNMPIKILDKNIDPTGQYCYFCNATITDSMIICENCGSKNKSMNVGKANSFSRSQSASVSSSDNPQLIKMIQCPHCKAKIKENGIIINIE